MVISEKELSNLKNEVWKFVESKFQKFEPNKTTEPNAITALESIEKYITETITSLYKIIDKLNIINKYFKDISAL